MWSAERDRAEGADGSPPSGGGGPERGGGSPVIALMVT